MGEIEDGNAHTAAHPMGVLPWGEMLRRGSLHSAKRNEGLGALSVLDDNQILMIVSHIGPRDLCDLARVSQTLHAFAFHEDIWRALALEDSEGAIAFRWTWRETFARKRNPAWFASSPNEQRLRPLRLTGVYSDVLHEPWMFAHMEIDPEWLVVDNMPRVRGISPADFRERFEIPNRPVVLEGVAEAWPALTKWTDEYLDQAFHGKEVVVSNAKIPMPEFRRYVREHRDESPLYLFDKTFVETAPELGDDFEVPAVFQDDLFSTLGQQRPDYRWLIMGPAKSGSSFHIDPNATSAWNAPIRGRKKWIMYPPGVVPPGVQASEDGATVATPLSLMEWFSKFYEHTRTGPVKPLECVCGPGDVVFVPSGWWHLVLNLDDSIALTQNFVSPPNLHKVMAVLKTRSPDLISGCPEEDRPLLYDRFVSALEAQRPDAWREAEKAAEKRAAKAGARIASLFKGAREHEGAGNSGAGGQVHGGFAFGFGTPNGGVEKGGEGAGKTGFAFGFRTPNGGAEKGGEGAGKKGFVFGFGGPSNSVEAGCGDGSEREADCDDARTAGVARVGMGRESRRGGDGTGVASGESGRKKRRT